MPGIFGIIDSERAPHARGPERADLIRRMAAAMTYERDYVVETLSISEMGMSAGWVGRSSAHRQATGPTPGATRLLLTAGEPVVDGDGSSELAVDEIAVGLGSVDLADAIQRQGLGVLESVAGPFAGLWIDRQAGRCVLFNDRYGAERIFAHIDGDRLFFSSEAKAILAVAPRTRDFDTAGLAEWLACGCTIGARSLFRDIEVLPAASSITFGAGCAPRRAQYFDRAALEQLPPLNREKFLARFDDVLGASVARAFRRAPKAAMSLTGGLDSRLVLACLDAPPHTVPCYTFGSMYRTSMDVAVAKAVANACDQDHRELTLDRGFLTGIEKHLRRAVYISDGYMGLTGASELYLNQMASSVAPTRITGNWGGELMRGVRAFKFRVPGGDFIAPPLKQLMTDAGKAFSAAGAWHPLSYTLFQQMPHQGYGRYAIERSQVLTRSPFLANAVVETLYQAPPESRASIETVMSVLRRRPRLSGIPTDIGRLGTSVAAVSAIRQRYRRAMVKAEYLTSHGAPNWMASLSARVPFLERAFLGRDKFQHFRVWMRNELSGFVRDRLGEGRNAELNAWFDMRQISRMVDAHIAGRANYTDSLDKVLTVATIHATFSNNPFAAGAVSNREVHELAVG